MKKERSLQLKGPIRVAISKKPFSISMLYGYDIDSILKPICVEKKTYLKVGEEIPLSIAINDNISETPPTLILSAD